MRASATKSGSVVQHVQDGRVPQLGSCQPAHACEEQQYKLLVTGDSGHCSACSPWRDPASLTLLQNDLRSLNIGALIAIYNAVGLPELDCQLLMNVCGTDMPPPGVFPGAPVPCTRSASADPLPGCPEIGLIRLHQHPEYETNNSLMQRDAELIQRDAEPRFTTGIIEAVDLLGMEIIIPKILCAAAQQKLDRDGHYVADPNVKPVPLPTELQKFCKSN